MTKEEMQEAFRRDLKESDFNYSDEMLYEMVLELRARIENLERTQSDGK